MTGAAIVSVALEGLIWRRPTRWVTAAVVLVAAGAAALDVAEIRRIAAAWAALATVIALTHLAVVAGNQSLTR